MSSWKDFGPRMTKVTLNNYSPSFQISWIYLYTYAFQMDENSFTNCLPCLLAEMAKVLLSSQASKMLYKPPGAVYIASYKEPLDQSDCWKLFVQL